MESRTDRFPGLNAWLSVTPINHTPSHSPRSVRASGAAVFVGIDPIRFLPDVLRRLNQS